jgi:geranylgeranyl pyrophosphate synthase
MRPFPNMGDYNNNMWQPGQIELLRKEIAESLSPLSNSTGLAGLVRESLAMSAGPDSEFEKGRPWSLLPLVVSEAISGHYEQALPAAAALYFMKTAAEVFDDIEDADSSGSLSARFGNAVANNTATTLLILAESALARLKARGVEPGLIVLILESVNSHYTIACAGQHLDLSLTPEMAASEDMYLKIAEMKSASVFACACQVGALLAAADQKFVDKFSSFGHNLGMAAQIANDIQGATGGSDIRKHKITLPAIYALTQTEGEAHQQLVDVFWRHTGPDFDLPGIRDLLFRCGAIHYTTLKMALYKQLALEILSEIEDEGINVERLRLFLK